MYVFLYLHNVNLLCGSVKFPAEVAGMAICELEVQSLFDTYKSHGMQQFQDSYNGAFQLPQ